jgi:integrase
MGRPSLDLGTAGTVRVYPVASGGFNAETRFRDRDGKIRRVERRGPTRSAASRALRLAVRDRIHVDSSSELTGDTKLRDLAQVYLNDIKSSDRSPSTIAQYADRLDKQILPALADVRLRELTVGRVDQFLQQVRMHHGPSLARMTRSVLSGMCALAARRDVMQFNPVRDTTPIRAKPANPAQPLDDFELGELRQTLLASELAHDLDVVDLVLFMIATGCRVGEALALMWTDVNLANCSVEIRTTAIRVKGQGVLIKNSPKTSTSRRTLELPAWCVDLLALRPRSESGLVFPAPRSGLVRDPSNTIKAIHRALGQKIKTHTYRKTLATLMDDAGLPTRKASDQLGHSRTSQTQDAYFGRKRLATGAASVLEGLFDT